MADTFDLKLRSDAEVQGLQSFEKELKQVITSSKAAGLATDSLERELQQVQVALGRRVGSAYADYLKELVASEKAAGRETAELERRLKALAAVQPPKASVQAQAVLGQSGEGMGNLMGQLGPLASQLPGIGSLLSKVSVGTLGWTAALVGLAAGLKGVAEDGIAFNSKLEDAQLGIAAVIKQFDKTGQFANFRQAMEASAAAIDLLKEKAVKSPASFEDLVGAFQATTGAATAANIPLKQQVDLILLMSQTLSGLGIRSEQIIQESRALLTGNINEDAAAARILGITKAQIDAAKEQGQLYEFLTSRMSGFAEAGEVGMKNLSTRTSNLNDAWTQLKGNFTKPLFDSQIIQSGVGALTEVVGHFAEITAETKTAGSGTDALAGAAAGVATVTKEIKLDDLLKDLDEAIKKTRQLRQEQEEIKDAEAAVKMAELDLAEAEALGNAGTEEEKDAIRLDFKKQRQGVRSAREVEKAQAGVSQAQAELDITKQKQADRAAADAARIGKVQEFEGKANQAAGVLEKGKNFLNDTQGMDYRTPEGAKQLQEYYQKIYEEGAEVMRKGGGSAALAGPQREKYEMSRQVLEALPQYQQNSQAARGLLISPEENEKKRQADEALKTQADSQERQLKVAQAKADIAAKSGQTEQKTLQQESAEFEKQKQRRAVEEANKVDQAEIARLKADSKQNQEVAINKLENNILGRNQTLPGQSPGDLALSQAQVEANNLRLKDLLEQRSGENAKKTLQGMSNADASLNLENDPRRFGETNEQRDQRTKGQSQARTRLDKALGAFEDGVTPAEIDEVIDAMEEAAKEFKGQSAAVRALKASILTLAAQIKNGNR